MEILYRNDYLSCVWHDSSDKPDIQVVKKAKDEAGKLSVTCNEIVFVMEGRIRYFFNGFVPFEAVKGQIVFRPSGWEYAYEALANAVIIVFRLHNPIELCRNFSLEKLFNIQRVEPGCLPEKGNNQVGILEMNSRVWYFLDGIVDCLSDGLRCRVWFEMKIREFLLLLRAYYTRQEIHDFFYFILSGDTAFSEYVRVNWQRFGSVNKLAASMNMTHKQFAARFAAIFGMPPYRWMTKNRAQMILEDITSTQKPFKQIAAENGFTEDTQLIRFCNKHFNATPAVLRARKEDQGK